MKRKFSLIMIVFVVFMFSSMISAVAVQGAQTYTGYLADILCVDGGTAADGANMETNPEDQVSFRIGVDENPDQFFKRINGIFMKVKELNTSIFFCISLYQRLKFIRLMYPFYSLLRCCSCNIE